MECVIQITYTKSVVWNQSILQPKEALILQKVVEFSH